MIQEKDKPENSIKKLHVKTGQTELIYKFPKAKIPEYKRKTQRIQVLKKVTIGRRTNTKHLSGRVPGNSNRWLTITMQTYY